MTQTGYSERDLVTNRAAVLLYGGSERDRRAWAEQAQANFPDEGELLEVTGSPGLEAALKHLRGVVYIPDVGALGPDLQTSLVQCLQQREERPKIIVGVPRALEEAREKGLLREDLLYRLDRARVDLSVAENREALKKRSASARPSAKPSASKGASKAAAPRAASRPAAKLAKKPAGKAGKR